MDDELITAAEPDAETEAEAEVDAEAEAEAEPSPRPAQPKREQKNKPAAKRRSKQMQRFLTGVLTVLLVILAVLVFVFRDALSGESLRQHFGKENSVAPAREAFTYETGAEQVFAPVGSGLAVASSSSVQLLDAGGKTVYKQVVSFELPAVFAGDEAALFCDLSGTDCIVVTMDGESRTLDNGRAVLTAGMNASGWFTVVTAEPGYKGLVSVYDADCEKRYEWWSGTGYVLGAAVSPDNRALAVLCAEKSGTKLHLFSLSSETQQAECSFDDVLLYDLYYMNSDTLCLLGETGLTYVAPDGSIRGEYPIDGAYMLDYAFCPNFAALFVSDYRSGAGGTLVTLDSRGEVLGTQTLERDVVSLSASGKQLLVMTGGGLVQYDQALVRQYANETLMTAKRAILRPGGDILLLSAYSAERFSF